MKYVIIGNGIAGVHAAEAIRHLDADGSITMIADEATDPYCRPMISLVLEGSIGPEKLPIRRASFHDDLSITPVLGQRVTRIDVQNKTVSIRDEKQFSYDRLLIATGADPRPIKASGSHLENVFFMRTAAHVRGMLDVLPRARSALVLGGGLVGFKAAYGLLRRGLKVTMLIASGYPLSLQVDETAGRLILEELMAHGLEVRVQVEATSFEGNGKVASAHLSDGTDFACDMVVVGKGVLPALSFLPRDAIRVDLGILVNDHLETSVPGVFAAGDVAESIDIARGTRWVNAIWPEAVMQGRIAGMNMAGRPVGYKGSLSRNVIRIFDLDVMTAGLVNPSLDKHHNVIQSSDRRHKTYRKLVFREDRLVGMALVNSIEQGGLLLSLIQNEIPVKIPRTVMLERSFNYKMLLAS